jgi:DnaJ-class molecular chaperone
MDNDKIPVVWCPCCKGKGHVLDAFPVIFIPVLGWALAALETNNPEGLTREKCSRCNGKGFIKIGGRL